MTKTIIIGENKNIKGEKIIFHKYLDNTGNILSSSLKPSNYSYIELICKNGIIAKEISYDLIFAYNNPDQRSGGILYLGKWNDGIV